MTTRATATYEYRAGSALPLYALKRRKAQKQRGFRAESTYGHCLDFCSVKSKGESNLIADRPRKSTRMPTRLTADWVETLIINRLSRGEQGETMASLLPAVL